jgi:hypothetical protein
MRGGPLAVLAVLLAGCFAPDAREGLPCSERGECPRGQSCTDGICRAGAASLVDAAAAGDGGEATDAAPLEPPGRFGTVEHVPLTCPGPVLCADVREPFLVPDRTAIVFTYLVNATSGNHDLLHASRASAEGAFTTAASLGGINSTACEHAAFLSLDGATLWFSRQDLSTGAPIRPYDQILASTRPGGVGPFDAAKGVDGGVNTALGDERSPQIAAGGDLMLFTRAPEAAMGDHDVYLARLEGGQWNTIERVIALSNTGADERAVGLVEDRRAIFFIRDEQIHEAIWVGDDPTELAVEIVHDELDASPLDVKVGVWSSPDGTEVWFDSNRSGVHQIYRAVRPALTPALSSGGRTRRRPIP